MTIGERLREQMVEEYGENADVVFELVQFFGDVITLDRSNAELLKAGCHRMAEVINDVLPTFERQGRTRVYNHKDLKGALDPIPPKVQDIFVALVGTLYLNAADGPYHAANRLSAGIDNLVNQLRKEET